MKKKGHLTTNINILCKNQVTIPDQQLILNLKVVKL